MSKSLAYAAVLALSLVAAPAFAQAPAAPAPTAAATVSASHFAVARELVMASGLSRSFAGVIPEMIVKMNQTYAVSRPDLSKDLRATLESLQAEFNGWSGEIVDIAARVYTAVMTEQECKEALALFQTAAGKKYVEVQPTIFVNVAPVVEQWSKAMSARMLNRVREEMKKKGHDM